MSCETTTAPGRLVTVVTCTLTCEENAWHPAKWPVEPDVPLRDKHKCLFSSVAHLCWNYTQPRQPNIKRGRTGGKYIPEQIYQNYPTAEFRISQKCVFKQLTITKDYRRPLWKRNYRTILLKISQQAFNRLRHPDFTWVQYTRFSEHGRRESSFCGSGRFKGAPTSEYTLIGAPIGLQS